MAKCPKCKKTISGKGVDYCPDCGTKIKKEAIMSKKKEVRKITLGLIVSWVLGVLFGISAIRFILQGAMKSGTALLVASLILLPPVNRFIKKEFNFELSKGVKIVVVIILLIVYGVYLPKETPAETIEISPPKLLPELTEPQPETEPETPKPTPVKKVKRATISIDRVVETVANLDSIRVTIANTGDVSIRPKFDVIVTDSSGKKVCEGSPMFGIGSVDIGEKKTDEIRLVGCMFEKDGTYNVKVDLLDEDYKKLDSGEKPLTVKYWGKFEF